MLVEQGNYIIFAIETNPTGHHVQIGTQSYSGPAASAHAVGMRAAAACVDSLASDSALLRDMTEYDRARFGLLRIKSADKAYIRHTSDSLLLTVTEYYERHPKAEGYPEALYYAGRVYSDLGDSPTALQFFQKAMDARAKLKGGYKPIDSKLSSQAGQLLNKMHIYGEAEKYMKKAIELNCPLHDTVGMIKDMIVWGAINLHVDSLERADSIFKEALMLCKPGSSHQAQLEAYRAGVQYRMGKYGKARELIVGVPQRVNPDFSSNAKAYAAQIFLNAGDKDSAAFYARSILKMKDTRNHAVAYEVLIDPRMRDMLRSDSLAAYYLRYGKLTSNFMNDADREASAIQNAAYNYSVHVNEKERERENKNKLFIYGVILASIVLLLAVVVMILLVRYNHQKIRILTIDRHNRTLQDLLNTVKSTSAKDFEEGEDSGSAAKEIICANQCIQTNGETNEIVDEETIRMAMRKELLAIVQASSNSRYASKNYVQPPRVKNSETFKELLEKIERKETIPETDKLWKDISDLVETEWPEFKVRLRILNGDPIRERDYRLYLLIKLGLRPKHLMILFGRGQGTFSSRRGALCENLLGVRISATALDIIILSL